MLNIKIIMKILSISVATVAILRLAAALLPQARPDHHEQLVHQPAQYQELIKNLASSDDFIEIPEPLAESKHTENLGLDGSRTSSFSQDEPEFALGTTGSQWAIVYHPYNPDGTCRTKTTVHSNLETISAKGFHSIRLHNHDCNILPKLSSSPLVLSHRVRLILGIHIDEEGLAAAAPNVDEIIAWGSGMASESESQNPTSDPPGRNSNWSTVEMVVVGEEVIFNGHAKADDLAAFIAATRSAFRRAGYSGPLTTTEPIHILYEARHQLCPHLDILASNIHPFFHTDVSAEHAGKFVQETLDLLASAVCSHSAVADGHAARPKIAVNLETGWPWRGRPNGDAVPGREEQRIALEGVMRRVGGRSVVLGFGDDEWMEEGEFGVEKSWGCDHLFPRRK